MHTQRQSPDHLIRESYCETTVLTINPLLMYNMLYNTVGTYVSSTESVSRQRGGIMNTIIN